jgi:hypothetical protein
MNITTLPGRFAGLKAGDHSVVVLDQNGCQTAITVTLTDPPALILQLEEDKSILRGQETPIEVAALNFTPATVRWTPTAGLTPPDSLTTVAAPERTTTYVLELTDAAGCTISDDITITVRTTSNVYAPNAFRPGSSENGAFTLYGGAELEQIDLLRIFDRWGDLVFEGRNLSPNVPTAGWDGLNQGQPAPQGVYIYMAEVQLANGEQEILWGEVTLIR